MHKHWHHQFTISYAPDLLSLVCVSEIFEIDLVPSMYQAICNPCAHSAMAIDIFKRTLSLVRNIHILLEPMHESDDTRVRIRTNGVTRHSNVVEKLVLVENESSTVGYLYGEPPVSGGSPHKQPIVWKVLPCHDVFMRQTRWKEMA